MYLSDIPTFLWQVSSNTHPVTNQVWTTRQEARAYKRLLFRDGIAAVITRFNVSNPTRVR